MPRRSILSAAERDSLFALPDTKEELIRAWFKNRLFGVTGASGLLPHEQRNFSVREWLQEATCLRLLRLVVSEAAPIRGA